MKPRVRLTTRVMMLTAFATCACSAGNPPAGSRGRTGSTGGADGGISLDTDGGDGTGINLDGSSGPPGTGPCENGRWDCAIEACEGMPKTSITATVYDPAGLVPLYNVAVYVPNEPLRPIADGATCDTCATPVSGAPLASALTNAEGIFSIQDVPSGQNVPLVIQIGKWRREISLPEVKPCQENAFSDPNVFRLPRNQTEGHIPKIALSAGEADSLECLLRRIGVDESEFTNPDGPGRVNIFADPCVTTDCEAPTSYANGTPYPVAATSLWGSVEALRAYDMVLMSCQGSQSAGREKTSEQKQGLKTYLESGGRVFLEHYHYSWLRGGNEAIEIEDARKYPPTPFPVLATWATPDDPNIDVGSEDAVQYLIDTSFPKGNDFADWLVNVGASPGGRGTISLIDVKHPALAVEPITQRWIHSAEAVPYFTANAPFAVPVEQQCGRLVHTGIHVAIAANDQPSSPFPSGCQSAPLSAQEKAMEFLLFDLSSCVMDDRAPPEPPPIVR